MTLPGNLPSSSPYTMPPEPTLSQNPLSIMMSRMSKFAMPSSTPLYHDAIKTVASSDDDSPPARSPNLPPMNNLSGKKQMLYRCAVAGSMWFGEYHREKLMKLQLACGKTVTH